MPSAQHNTKTPLLMSWLPTTTFSDMSFDLIVAGRCVWRQSNQEMEVDMCEARELLHV